MQAELKQRCVKALQCKNPQEWWANLLQVVDARDRLLAAPSSSPPPVRSSSSELELKAFTAWLHSYSGFESNELVEFRPHPLAGNGVFVSSSQGKQIEKGEVVFTIPLEMCIGYQSPLSKEALGNQLVRSNASIELALCLLEEKRQGGRFQPYIAILPTQFPTLPMTWSRQELELIQDLNVSVVIGHRVLDICLSYCHLAEVGLLPGVSLQEFIWAVCVVFTRQNPLPGGKLALIPGFDMCNHDAALGEITTGVNANNQLESRAAKTFAAGDEVTIFYGPRPNDEFLSHAGFVVQNNQHSKVILPLQLQVVLPVQHVLLNQVPNVTRSADAGYLLTIGWQDSTALVAFARASCARDKDSAAAALRRKLAGDVTELTSDERQLIRALLLDQIGKHTASPSTASTARAQVVRVVGELRASIVDLLQALLAKYE